MLFNSISGAMTTYDDAKMIYFVNVTQYFELNNPIGRTLNISDNLCLTLRPHSTDDICHLQIDRLKMDMANTARDDEEIKAGR